MARKVLFLLVVTGLLLAAPVAAQPRAGDCLVGPGLGATLLVPYFEVDLTNPSGRTTLISVNNGLSAQAMVRVVLWTDWAVPTLAFDVYLKGFDVQTMNLRDQLNGTIPSTGQGVDLSSFPFCGGLPPFHANPVLTPNQRQQIANWHRGLTGPVQTKCAGHNYGDGLARGYVTIDVVDECSGVEAILPGFTPTNIGYPYFANGGGGAGIGVAQGRIWGDVIYVDPGSDYAQGVEAVAVWSDPALFSVGHEYTFYGRYSGWDGRDERVPLPYRWDQRFLNGGPFTGGTEMIVWRDTGSSAHAPVTCGSVPAWLPLMATVAVMNEDAGAPTFLPNDLFPLATQRLNLTGLGLPYPFGWMQVTANPLGQIWVVPTMSAEGRYSVSWDGTPVEFLCDKTPP